MKARESKKKSGTDLTDGVTDQRHELNRKKWTWTNMRKGKMKDRVD